MFKDDVYYMVMHYKLHSTLNHLTVEVVIFCGRDLDVVELTLLEVDILAGDEDFAIHLG